MLTLTDKAASAFTHIRQAQNHPHTALRIAVLGGDCAGLAYHICLEDFRASDDICIRSKGIDIYIDHLSYPYLEGSELDWIEQEGESGFWISNPNKGRSRGGCSNDGSGEGCMTLGDGKTCIKEKASPCSCNVDPTEIIYRIEK